jgi:chromosome segregation ATPase
LQARVAELEDMLEASTKSLEQLTLELDSLRAAKERAEHALASLKTERGVSVDEGLIEELKRKRDVAYQRYQETVEEVNKLQKDYVSLNVLQNGIDSKFMNSIPTIMQNKVYNELDRARAAQEEGERQLQEAIKDKVRWTLHRVYMWKN